MNLKPIPILCFSLFSDLVESHDSSGPLPLLGQNDHEVYLQRGWEGGGYALKYMHYICMAYGVIYMLLDYHMCHLSLLCVLSPCTKHGVGLTERKRERVRGEGGKRGRERDKEKREVSPKIEWKAQARHSHQRSPPVVPNGNSGAYHLGFQKSPCQLRE